VDRRQINPWTWQDRAGFSQAWRIDDGASIVLASGQVAVSAEGEVLAPGDIVAQARQAFENLGTVLEQAGASFADVMKLTLYLTDISRLREVGSVRDEFIDTTRPPASTAIGVAALALPELMIEVDAIAVL
jgi:enamine deaminase RidA (YjgF/YER057c/UK114 family)